jgi:hypothetical protein
VLVVARAEETEDEGEELLGEVGAVVLPAASAMEERTCGGGLRLHRVEGHWPMGHGAAADCRGRGGEWGRKKVRRKQNPMRKIEEKNKHGVLLLFYSFGPLYEAVLSNNFSKTTQLHQESSS